MTSFRTDSDTLTNSHIDHVKFVKEVTDIPVPEPATPVIPDGEYLLAPVNRVWQMELRHATRACTQVVVMRNCRRNILRDIIRYIRSQRHASGLW